MISQKHRLTQSQVLEVKAAGQTTNSNHFTFVTKDSRDHTAHFAIIVSKKISPKAVVRNKLRRRWYTITSQHLLHRLSILIIPHQGILKQNPEEVAKDLSQSLTKLCLKNS